MGAQALVRYGVGAMADDGGFWTAVAGCFGRVGDIELRWSLGRMVGLSVVSGWLSVVSGQLAVVGCQWSGGGLDWAGFSWRLSVVRRVLEESGVGACEKVRGMHWPSQRHLHEAF